MRPALCCLMALAFAWPAGAFADESTCSPMLEPAQISLRESGFDMSRSACVAEKYQLGARSYALIDTPNFYGTLAGSIYFDWSMVHLSGFELGLGARLLDARFVQSAVLPMSELAAGPLRAWAVKPRETTLFGIDAIVSHALLLDIPATNFSLSVPSLAASPALLVTFKPSADFRWHARLAALLWAALPESGVDHRAALAASTDVALRTWSWLAFTAGVEVQGGWYGLGLDHLVPRGGARFGWGKGHAIELTAGTAVLGEERADLSMWLGYRFVEPREAPPPRRSRVGNW
jgi:hypothetical protein